MDAIDKAMHQAVARKVFPGGQLIASQNGRIMIDRVYGLANPLTKQAVTRHTVYDLASLTKPLATTLALMVLIQKMRLKLDQVLSSVIAELQNTSKAEIKIRHLLAHTSGLPDYQPYYLDLHRLSKDRRKDALHEKLAKEPLVAEIGKQTRYSDIGFMLLLWVIEEITQMTLDKFVQTKIYDPLNIADLFFIAHDQFVPDKPYAVTEICPWRQKVLEGCVHDDNAYVMGGIAGHAGLFGTATAVHELLWILLQNFRNNYSGHVFSSESVRIFLQKQDGMDRRLGFDVPSPVGSSCGTMFGKDATVGHLGFTGTSFWMDMNRQIIVVLLTNRVHPSRQNAEIKQFRPIIHDLVMKHLKRLSPLE